MSKDSTSYPSVGQFDLSGILENIIFSQLKIVEVNLCHRECYISFPQILIIFFFKSALSFFFRSASVIRKLHSLIFFLSSQFHYLDIII